MKKKTLIILLALVLVFGIAVGGTIAYLTTKSDDVKNTFVASDIGKLELKETDTDGDGSMTTQKNTYMVVPGVDITKDPKLTYTINQDATSDNDVPVYVFVKVTAKGWTVSGNSYKFPIGDVADGLSATVCDGWTELTGVTLGEGEHVYYKELAANTAMAATSLITGDKVTVSADITDAGLQATTFQNLDFMAYACQSQGLSAAEAWAQVKDMQ